MSTVFGRVLLLTGSAEFLVERTRRSAVRAIMAEQPECEVAEVQAAALGPGELLTLTSPGLFSASSAVVVTGLADVDEAVGKELLAYVAAPSPDVALVLIHGGGNKGRKLLESLRSLAAVTERAHETPRYERDVVSWVRGEFKQLGCLIDEPTAAFLVTAVGQDLRALAGAADQLAASVAPGSPIEIELVRQYFGGRAEVRGYEIADAALDGRIDVAMEKARWAAAARVAPVLITSALASGLRQLIKLATAPRGLRDAQLAAHVGAPPFKLRALRQTLAGWNEEGLAQALRHVADADLSVKGGGADPAYAVERMILQVAAARGTTPRGR